MGKVGELFVTIGGSWGGLSSTMTSAQGQIEAFGKKWQSTSEMFTRSGQMMDQAGEAIDRSLDSAVETASTFEASMSGVDAATDATGQEMQQLSALALRMGADTVFGATDAASGIEELEKAGLATQDVLGGGLSGALNLAAAGEISVGDAAKTTAEAMAIFGLKGSEATHVADLFASAASASLADVSDLRLGFQQSALVAESWGLTIEQTTGILAMFSQHALKGSDGGTAFKTMLQRMIPTGKEASAMMVKLGLDFFDGNEQFIGISAVAEQLKTKLGGLSEEQRQLALRTIFGSDAVRAAIELYKAGGAGVDEWTDKVNQAGAAQEMAAVRMDNLKGATEQYNGAVETAQIAIGNGLIPAQRLLTEWLTAGVERFNNLTPAVQESVAVIGKLTAMTLQVGGETMKFIGMIPMFVQGLQILTPSVTALGLSMKGVAAFTIGAAVAMAAMGLIEYAQQTDKALESTDRFTARSIEGFDKIKGKIFESAAAQEAFRKTVETTTVTATGLWNSFLNFAKPVVGMVGGTTVAHQQLTSAVTTTTQAVDAFRGAQTTAMTEAQTRVEEYAQTWEDIPDTTSSCITQLTDDLDRVSFHLTTIEDQQHRVTSGFEEMGRGLSGFQTSMEHFQGFRGISGPILGIGGMGTFPGMASGGTVMRSGAAMVGERGPEVMDFPSGARVRPLGGAGGASVVNYNTYITVQGSVVHERDIWRLARDGGIKHGRSNLGKNLA